MTPLLAAALSALLLQAAPPDLPALGPVGPRLPSIRRTVNTTETLTLEQYQWETSSGGGPMHVERHPEMVGQTWLRSFDLALTDVEQHLASPGERTRRQFDVAVDRLVHVYGQPSTGPDEEFWYLHGWTEGLAFDLVRKAAGAPAEYVEWSEQPSTPGDETRLERLRGDCALGLLARAISSQKPGSAQLLVEPGLLRDVLFPGGELFNYLFSLPEDKSLADHTVWFEPFPGWAYVEGAGRFGTCKGTIELRLKPQDGSVAGGRTTFSVSVRVKCHADLSHIAEAQKIAYRNNLSLVDYDDQLDTTYELDGELVYDAATTAALSLRLAGTVAIAESMKVMRFGRDPIGLSNSLGTFRAKGKLENKWMVER